MKKIITNVMFVAVAAMAFSACQKTEMVEPETSQEVMLTFASEKPAFDEETKTEWTGETIRWSAGDKIAIAYTVAGKWQNELGDASGDAKLYKSDALEAATETAKFNVSAYFKGTTGGTHVFYGVYPAPSSTSFADAPDATLTVPSIQTPGAASFDGSADLMTGVSVGEFTSLPTEGETISMKWTRLVAHANITLKALNGVTAGETVSSIMLTAQEGANLVGSQKVDITANTVVNNNNESNVLELNGGNLSIDASGNIEFWACVLPETLTSLAVVVETNKATYTREITGISKTFKQNARNTLTIKMNEATRVAKGTSDYSGEWLITGVKDEQVYAASAYVSGNNLKSVAISIENGQILEVDGIANCMMTLTKVADGDYAGMYTITDVNGKYLYAASSSGNQLKGATEVSVNAYWTVELQENGTYSIVASKSSNRNVMQFNGSDADNILFNCYSSASQSPVTLYPYSMVKADTTPRITVEETEYKVSADDETLEFSYTTRNIDGTPTVSVAEGATMTNVKAAVKAAAEAGGTVTVTFDANAEEKEKTATVVLSYKDADPVYVTITQAAKAAEGGESGWIATDFADLKENDQVVIVGIKSEKYYAMSNDNGTSKGPAPIEVSISGSKLANEPAANTIWYVGVDGNNRIFYKDSGKDTWLYCTATNNGVRVGTNDNKTFAWTNNYLQHKGTSRYLGIYNVQDWRCYTSHTATNIANQTFQFFVKTGESGGEEGGETPAYPVQLIMSDITCSAQTENSLTFNWAAVANATGYEVTCNNKTETVNDVTYTATGLTASTQYTISVKAVGDGTNYTTSEAKTQTGTTAAAQGGGETSKTWKLVTDASTLTAGDKLAIVSSSKGKVAGSLTSQYLESIAVTITGNAFSTLPSGAVEFTLGGASGAWTLAGSDGKLLGATAVKKLAWGSGTTTWSISIDNNGDATIQNGTSSYGRFLYNNSSPRFTTYTSNATSSMLLPQIYRYE